MHGETRIAMALRWTEKEFCCTVRAGGDLTGFSFGRYNPAIAFSSIPIVKESE
jgi:hypothetical protein